MPEMAHTHECPKCRERWTHEHHSFATKAELVELHTCKHCSGAVEQWYPAGHSRASHLDQRHQRQVAAAENQYLFPFDLISDKVAAIYGVS